MVNYILLPVFALFVVGWKLWHRTRIVKLAEMDIWTGRREREVGYEEYGGKGWKNDKGWRGKVYRGVVG